MDSADEWEEEEPGEDLEKQSDGEGEEDEEEMEEEEEDPFFVPHGYLSEDEGAGSSPESSDEEDEEEDDEDEDDDDEGVSTGRFGCSCVLLLTLFAPFSFVTRWGPLTEVSLSLCLLSRVCPRKREK